MILNTETFRGMCSCGREHSMCTNLVIIEPGCLADVKAHMAQCGLGGITAAVYDTNTYQATEGKHPQVDREIILDPENLHANEHGVELLKNQLPDNVAVLIAIGSGTIHDLTRYCAYQAGVPFVSCPTAASVDGFCSSVAAMTWGGCKVTLTATAPVLVAADLDVIRNAPVHLAKSGFGDMIGKYIALTEWRIGHILTGEYHCQRIAQMTLDAANAVLESADGILSGSTETYEKLMYGLVLSGLAMQMMGNSRPASGAEHHISHLIEMAPQGLGVHSDALHGEKVGVATLLVLELYHRIAASDHLWTDYTPYSEDYLSPVFGDLTPSILKENKVDCATGIAGEQLTRCFPKIATLIRQLPSVDDLRETYIRLGIKNTLSDIQVDNGKQEQLIAYAPCVRNRLTLMRLLKCMQ